MTETLTKTKTARGARVRKAPAKAKALTKITHLKCILDRSGSMAGSASDVRGGFNAYIEALKKDGNTYRVSMVQFSDLVVPVFTNLALADVPKLDMHNYTVGGNTALYDAIGKTLEEDRATWETKAHPYGEDAFLVVIMTDGEENASRRFTKEDIVEAIKRREEAGNWTFAYLGANQDAWEIGSSLGLAKGNVIAYASADTPQVFQRLATSTSASATSSTLATRGFFGNDPSGTASSVPPTTITIP